MSEKALKILVGVLGASVVVWLVISFAPGSRSHAIEPSESLSAFFSGVTPETVSAIRLQSHNQEPIELKRLGPEWIVNGFSADSATVARFWSDLAGTEVGGLVASNPANHPRMGLSPDSARSLALSVSGEERTLLVGNAGPSYGSAYVRLPQEDDVHLLRGNLRPHLTRKLDDWRNKSLARIDTASLQRVEVDGEGGRFALERRDSLWVREGGRETDPSVVRNLLSELAHLDASGFYGSSDSLSESGATLTALGQAGDTMLVLELGSGDGDRWARRQGDSIIYRIASWRASRLLPDPDAVTAGR